MKPQKQLYPAVGILDVSSGVPASEAPVGDCWRTAIASILDMDAADVPHFVDIQLRHLDGNGELTDDAWSVDSLTRAWLEDRGLGYKGFVFGDPEEPSTMRLPLAWDELQWFQQSIGTTLRYVVFCGKSPRGDWMHAVVGDMSTGEIASDPHPSDDGLADLQQVWIIG